MIDSTRVMTALKDCKLPNAMVAEGTGICMYSISKYKRGIAMPNGVNLRKLAAYFNIPDVAPVREPEMTAADYAEIIRRLTEQNQQLMSIISSALCGGLGSACQC